MRRTIVTCTAKHAVLLAAGLSLGLGCAEEPGDTPAGETSGPPPDPIPMYFVDRSAELLPGAAAADGRVATLADLDGDGLVDIVQPTSAGMRLFWGTGAAFEADDGELGSAFRNKTVSQVLAGDFDGDGLADLFAVGEPSSEGPLLVQTTGRSFSSLGEQPGGGSAAGVPGRATSGAVLDADEDGDLDIVLVTLESPHDGGEGGGGAGGGGGSGGNDGGDGDGGSAGGAGGAGGGPPAGPPEPRLALLINDGAGRFSEESATRVAASGLLPYAVAAGDLDGDGHVDLFLTGDGAAHRLLRGDGQGAFTDAPPDALPSDIAPMGRLPALGDLNGDGALDVLIPSATANAVLLNDGAGRFLDETPFVLGALPGTGHSAVISDLDLDGHADVVVADPQHRLALYRNDGSARLFDYGSRVIPRGPEPSGAVSVGAADLDADGDPDLFVSRDGLALPWLLLSWHPEPVVDEDGDSVPDAVDNCPGVPNPDQENRDARHFDCDSGLSCAAQTGCELVLRDDETAYLVCRDAALDWAQAREACRKRGADLVVVDDAEENAYLADLDIETFWLGLSDAEMEGAFVWVDGDAPEYEAWAEGEPNDSGGVEDCATISPGKDGAGAWNDLDCAAARPFVCEDGVARTPEDPGDACDTCPLLHDPDQKDTDDDGIGDACQPEASE